MNHTANDLYTAQAELYTLFSNDRDFQTEVSRMGVRRLPGTATFVELCAGPAYHSRALMALAWPGHLVAIDKSAEMSNIAHRLGFQGKYVCADVVDGLSTLETADVVCFPRYSIVYLDSSAVAALFAAVASLLEPDGLFFVEVHKSSVVTGNVADYSWSTQVIQRRELRTAGATIEWKWPTSITTVDPNRRIIDMTLRITATSDSGQREEYTFHSVEHLHSIHYLDDCARHAGLMRLEHAAFSTSDGLFLAYGAHWRSGC